MSEPASRPLPWVRRMSGRDPGEAHRASTLLELLFDLTFVVAVARAGLGLRDALAQGHAGHALAGYAAVFFGVWWAWVNFTWFASAYDTDDVPYRLLTLLQMAGVLVFAAGIPAAFGHFDFTTVVAGYVIMRLALVAQWLHAAHGHPEGRAGTLRYAAGIAVVQLCWIGWLALPGLSRPAGFLRAGGRRTGGTGLGRVRRPGHALASGPHHRTVRRVHHHRARGSRRGDRRRGPRSGRPQPGLAQPAHRRTPGNPPAALTGPSTTDRLLLPKARWAPCRSNQRILSLAGRSGQGVRS
jgi:hypothetical protein